MGIFSSIVARSRKAISSIEESKAPMAYFAVTFLAIINLRTFLEVFSDKIDVSFNYILHYNLFYTAVALTFLLLFHWLLKVEVAKLAKLMLPSFAVLLIAPIFDLAVTLGKGFDMSYLIPGYHGDLLLRFFTFFGDFPGRGITPGIRVGVGLGILGSIFITYLKRKNALKALLAGVMTYVVLFLYAITPFIIKALLGIFGVEYKWSDALLSSYFLALILVFGLIISYIAKKDYFKAIVRDLRILRVLAFVLLFFLGVVMGIHALAGLPGAEFRLLSTNIFSFLFIPVSIVFAILFLIVTNNIADYEIDKVSNRHRPLFDSKINPKYYEALGWYFLAVSFVFSLMVSFQAFFMVLLFVGVYSLYSLPPLSLKRVLFLSKLLHGVNALLMVMLGYLFITQSLSGFPGVVMASFLIGSTLVGNIIDIKDYEGDKSAGVKTLPVLMGLKWSKMLIGLLVLATYVGIGILLQDELYARAVFALMGLLLFYLINKKRYDEKIIFVVFLLSIVVTIISL